MSAAASLATAVLDALREDSAARDELRELLGVASSAKPTDEPRWMNSDQAAEYLGCSRDRIHDLVQLRKIEARRDGRRLLFRCEELDAYLESSD
jgi:excisionase family DNA binding protein